MTTEECFALIESKFDHLFTTDRENNAITLMPGFGNITPFTMVCVEGGDFMMDENGKRDNEKPHQRVSVNSFFMAEFPVTQKLYFSVTSKNPSKFEGVKHPVEQVSWYDAVAFCNQLNELLNFPVPYGGNGEGTKCNFQCTAFRLPTEAEWEYAARGGVVKTKFNVYPSIATQQSKYAGSDNVNDVSWYGKNDGYETKPVGLKFPNQLGLYDMSGNVYEWCWDRYRDSYRILRGGSWNYGAGFSRVASRYYITPDNFWYDYGFRFLLALEVASGPEK
jgi:formylglycine-generating enzyme required for sulfatase activity